MDLARARCPECQRPMQVSRVNCRACRLAVEGEFELSALARLSPENQVFVMAFVRSHGSIKKMESLFDISYPTVKNRLNQIGAQLDQGFEAPSSNAVVIEQLRRGEISVEEALERLS